MMQTFRKNTRLILFIALAAFALLIFFQWGLDITDKNTNPETNIVEFDNIKVSYSDYLRYVQNKEAERRGVTREEIWNELLDDLMWNKLIQKEHIMMTDEELWAIIRNNPPRQVLESDYFKNEKGEFDFNKYLDVLRRPESQAWLQEYEMNIRRELPRQKIRSILATMGWVSPFEDSLTAVKQTTTCDFTFISVPLFKLRSRIKIDTSEVELYFNDNIKDFTTPGSKKVKFVFFERTPSVMDTNEARERVEDFILRMKEGEDFLTVAKEISDDTLVEKSLVDISELPPHLIDNFKTLKNGQISGILQGPSGFEVIKKVNKGLIYIVKANITTSISTISDIHDKIEAFKEAAKEHGFEETAQEYNLAVRKSYPLNPHKVTFPVRSTDELSKFLSKDNWREIAGPMNSIAGYYLFMLDSVIPEKIMIFDQNYPLIKARYEREKLKDDLALFMDKIHQQLIGGKPIEQVAFEDTLIILQKDSKSILQIQSQYGLEFAGAAAALEPKQISSPLLTEWSGYVIRCDNKKAVPFDSTMMGYLQMGRQMRLQYLTQDIFTPKKVKDNRDKFFE